MNDFANSGPSAPSIPDSPASEPAADFGHPVDIASDPIVTERRHAVLGELAKDESVEEYARERGDEEDAIFRGKALPEERQRQWYRRASRALTNAANEAAGIQPNGQQPQQQSQQQPQYRAAVAGGV
jgi:hypothetical protein